MSTERKDLTVLGLGQRGNIYARFAQKYPEKFRLAAIIETNPRTIEYAKSQYPGVPVFDDYKKFLAAKIHSDVVAVCTQDNQHKEHAIAMMAAGYDLLLEKPVANNRQDCLEIYEASRKYHKTVVVCHVLRYTPFYSTVKKIIDDGRLGDIVTLSASENVGYFHQAHSFVRGPWRNKTESSPMILAKCCHDLDIIRYLMGEPCQSVNSYGGLYYFNQEHKPKNAAKYCSDCKYTDCIYKAQTLYTAEGKRWCASYFSTEESDDRILADLIHTPYDRCVFGCDNDVVDHQVTIMNFAGGKTANHTMTAFSRDIYRDLKIYGTKAQLVGVVEQNALEIRNFGGEIEKIDVNVSAANVGGHSGGDFFMMESLYKTLNGEKADGVTYLDVSIESHLMAFAAEESRLLNGLPRKIY